MWKWTKRQANRASEFRPIKIVIGIVFLLLGIAGLLLPILPGWLFILLGLVWLGVIEKEDIKRWLKCLRQR